MKIKIIKDTFKPSNMVITLCNIIFFIVVQTLFFKFIASKQFNIVLQNKMGIINNFANNNLSVKKQIQEYLLTEEAKNISNNAKSENLVREKKNLKLIKNKIGPILGLCFILLLMFIFIMIYNKNKNIKPIWSSTDTAILSLVLFAYSTELMFYFGIVRNYEFFGDQELYNKLYNNVKQYINAPNETQNISDLNDLNKKILNNNTINNIKSYIFS
jgi:hypothetical protein